LLRKERSHSKQEKPNASVQSPEPTDALDWLTTDDCQH
jgi:hypothetical protein